MQKKEDRLTHINLRLAELKSEEKALKEQKQVLKTKKPDVAPNKARAMLPGPEEIYGTQMMIWDHLRACSRVKVSTDDLKDAFAAPTWRKIMNRLCRLLVCSGPDIVLVYRTSKAKECHQVNLLAFKNRLNYRFRAFCDALSVEGDGKVAFWPGTGTMTITETTLLKNHVGEQLHQYFRFIVDVRAGVIFQANSENIGFRPSFSKREGVIHAKILNNIVAYAYRAEQNGEKDWEKVLRRYDATDPAECELAKKGAELGESILRMLNGTTALPTGMSLKEFVLKRYSEILLGIDH